MNNISDLSRYYASQIRSIGNTNINIIFGILFVLFIIWHGTLNNLQLKIREAVSEKHRATQLARLARTLKKDVDTLVSKDTSYFARPMPGIPDVQTFNAKSNYHREIERKKEMKVAVEKQKVRALNAFKSIKDSIIVEYDIPTLKSVKEKSRIGTMLWLFLLDICLLLLLLAREKIFSYLRKLVNALHSDKTPAEDFFKLDLHLPFWIYPLKISAIKDDWQATANALIKPHAKRSHFVFLALILLPVTCLQIHVFLINWNLNAQIYTDRYSLFSKTLSLVLLAIYFSLIIFWFFVRHTITDSRPEKFSSTRRQFIRTAVLGIPGILLLFSIPSIGKTLPLIQPADLRRKRVRKDSMNANPLNVKPGFYTNRNRVIHYVSPGGICKSLKTVTPDTRKAFLAALVLIPGIEFLEKNKEKLSIHFLPWVIATEVRHLQALNKMDEAARLLAIGLHKADRNKISEFHGLLNLTDNFIRRYNGPLKSGLQTKLLELSNILRQQ